MSTPLSVQDYRGPLEDGCDVWWASISSQRPWHSELLNDVETDRANRYRRAEDRGRFVVGVALTRALAGAALGIDPVTVALDRTCPQCGQPHGRPVVVDGGQRSPALTLSIAHSGEWVVLAMSWGVGVGADVEQVVERADNKTLAARFFTEAEQNAIAAYPSWTDGFYRHWTAKESALKATGEGLSTALTELTVPPPSAADGSVYFRSRDYLNGTLQRLDAPRGYQGAVTTLTPQKVPLRTLRATASQVPGERDWSVHS